MQYNPHSLMRTLRQSSGAVDTTGILSKADQLLSYPIEFTISQLHFKDCSQGKKLSNTCTRSHNSLIIYYSLCLFILPGITRVSVYRVPGTCVGTGAMDMNCTLEDCRLEGKEAGLARVSGLRELMAKGCAAGSTWEKQGAHDKSSDKDE